MPTSATILIVDDIESNRETLHALLETGEYLLLEAADGPTALKLAAETPPDLVLLDVMMPSMSGFEVCRRMRADSRLAEVPVIMVTALDDHPSRLAGIEAGADDFISKPFNSAEMRARVRTVTRLNRYRRLHETQEHLRDSEERFRTLFELGPVAKYSCDASGMIQAFNRRAANLWGREPKLGQAVDRYCGSFKLFLPDGTPVAHAECPMAQVLNGTIPTANDMEVNIERPDGSCITVLVNIVSIKNDQGAITGAINSFHDVTDRKQIEAALRDSEAKLRQTQKMDAIGQLAGGMAHDFNNQLSIILGYADMLKIEAAHSKVNKYAAHICEAVHRSADLTRNLLAFARKGQNQTKPVQVQKIILETIEMLSRTIDKRIEIRHLFNASSDLVLGDPSQLQHAFINLGVNARDAMSANGCLVFETMCLMVDDVFVARHGGEIDVGLHIKVSVSDTGSGMTDEVKKHLFEPFFTTKPVGKGTGLGLASVYGTIKNHKGTMEVHSEVGRGTSFDLFLPLIEPSIEESEIVSGHSTSAKLEKVKNLCVLLVEDEEILRIMFGNMLSDSGIDYLEGENGRHAVEVYKQHWRKIDIVILDMIMPEMGGSDAFRAMKKINPDIRALFSTGYSLNNEIQGGLDEGVLGYIEKPFKRNDLLDKIIGVMG